MALNDLDRIVRFLGDQGFTVTRTPKMQPPGFVNGVYCDGMTIYVDPAKLVSAGDILHEAGHIAVVPSQFRHRMIGDFSQPLDAIMEYFDTHELMIDSLHEDMVYRALLQTGEMEAQAWSFAAALAADVPPNVVFHHKNHAYEDGSADIVLGLSFGQHFGVHGLQAAGMTTCREFPKMRRWLQL